MTSVWYVGRSGSRILTVEEWGSLGVVAESDTVWNWDNGYSVTYSELTSEQIALLGSLDGFLIEQEDGPRDYPLPPPGTPQGDTATLRESRKVLNRIRQIREQVEAEALTTRPAMFLDPRLLDDGPITQMTKGELHSVFGNAPLKILGGRIVHEPGAIATGNIAGYLQGNLEGKKVTRIGALAYWPAGSATAVVCLALSKLPGWNNPPGTSVGVTCPIHITMNGAGSINCARYVMPGGTLNDQRFARAYLTPFTGRSHVMEVFLLHDEQRVIVTVDGAKYADFTDVLFFDSLSSFPVWELFGPYNVTPAKLLAVWADTEDVGVPTSQPALDLGSVPLGMTLPRSTSDSTTGTFTTTQVAVWEDVGAFLPSHTFHFPESGRVLLRVSVWASTTAGEMLLRAMNTGGSKVLSTNQAGRAVLEQVYVGTPGTTDVRTLSLQAYMTGGVGTLTKGGSVGAIVCTSIPLA